MGEPSVAKGSTSPDLEIIDRGDTG